MAFDGIWKHYFPYGGPEHWFEEFGLDPDLSEKERKDMIDQYTRQAERALEGSVPIEGFQVPNPYPFMGRRETLHTWYHILVGAELGSRALRFVRQGKLNHLIDCTDNLVECDWSYYIDFDHEKMEVWQFGSFEEEVAFDQLRKDPEYMCEAFM
ncbi:hypothetical protein, variant [Cryptococcus amylolentus CBS 6039]|uniref:Uncharacterized protein n=2 Tax=Cryptococcus amylolentus TaxID=104669 RepID=A0A1E3I4X9_9TREE|nr:hypothetical protein L202_01818 [Cryptococcus amylolentus CBS 6039]XP_018997725.1 hypothetical protein, variant [Cryptococcus amylolentus CBS 6039]ODN83724.1 hypothetical protein L202_01818 [Cryptococcus amylolentus CBS 6039]ODN83725.1 hypothetical protein, variant [Cryptococcus amylolentus CBS 6039]ODO11194.1 hypothetical protein I350_01798 [Cryptococcus amylolentus CBS 6273]